MTSEFLWRKVPDPYCKEKFILSDRKDSKYARKNIIFFRQLFPKSSAHLAGARELEEVVYESLLLGPDRGTYNIMQDPTLSTLVTERCEGEIVIS